MDANTEAATLRLQMSDIEALLERKDTHGADELASLKAVRDELKRALTVNDGRQLAEILSLDNQADWTHPITECHNGYEFVQPWEFPISGPYDARVDLTTFGEAKLNPFLRGSDIRFPA